MMPGQAVFRRMTEDAAVRELTVMEFPPAISVPFWADVFDGLNSRLDAYEGPDVDPIFRNPPEHDRLLRLEFDEIEFFLVVSDEGLSGLTSYFSVTFEDGIDFVSVANVYAEKVFSVALDEVRLGIYPYVVGQPPKFWPIP
jgi:hypothetical protein